MLGCVAVAAFLTSIVTGVPIGDPVHPTAGATAPGSSISSIVRSTMSNYRLRAVIVRVTRGNTVLTTQGYGASMDGVPATTAMHFRNGAVAFAYVSTLLLEYVEEHKVTLNETIDHWLPDLPESHQVTLKMLAIQTSGYPDFETDPAWNTAFNDNPFQIFGYQERLRYAFDRPVQFAPGANWSYSHTNFMILGRI
jgi:CubicO group peptidase (beta-lactamase class C family)